MCVAKIMTKDPKFVIKSSLFWICIKQKATCMSTFGLDNLFWLTLFYEFPLNVVKIMSELRPVQLLMEQFVVT